MGAYEQLKQYVGQRLTVTGADAGQCIVRGCVGCGVELIIYRKCHMGYCKKCKERLNYRKRQAAKGKSIEKLYRGQTKHPLYNVHRSMKDRCLNKNDSRYLDYGGRGINITSRWLGPDGFFNFVKDMGERPNGYTLDRVNVNGNYEPSNCKWSSQREQGANRRNNNSMVGITKTNNSWRASLYYGGNRYRKTFNELDDAIKYRKQLERMYPV